MLYSFAAGAGGEKSLLEPGSFKEMKAASRLAAKAEAYSEGARGRQRRKIAA
jgi:hypothetical protein